MTSDFQLFNETDMLQPPEFQRDRASVDRRGTTAHRRPAELLEDGRAPRFPSGSWRQVIIWLSESFTRRAFLCWGQRGTMLLHLKREAHSFWEPEKKASKAPPTPEPFPGRPCQTSDLRLQDNKAVLFEATKLMALCLRSNRKIIVFGKNERLPS